MGYEQRPFSSVKHSHVEVSRKSKRFRSSAEISVQQCGNNLPRLDSATNLSPIKTHCHLQLVDGDHSDVAVLYDLGRLLDYDIASLFNKSSNHASNRTVCIVMPHRIANGAAPPLVALQTANVNLS
jgi:hypothetical protein